jgi:hypothetical protein
MRHTPAKVYNNFVSKRGIKRAQCCETLDSSKHTFETLTMSLMSCFCLMLIVSIELTSRARQVA